MADLVVRIDANAKKFDDELKAIGKKTVNLEKQLGNVAKISGVAFAGLATSIGLAVSQAAKFETIQTSFEVLTGSAEKAAKSIKELSDFSAKTPFQFEEIAKAGQKLLGFGFEAEKLPEILGQIGDVAAAVGTPLGDVALIFGQVEAAGKLTGERLLQLQERAIPIGPALAKSLGVAEDEIKDLVSAGKVTDEVFKAAFATLTEEGGAAFGGMAKQSATLNGLISTLKDNFSLVAAEIGKAFLPVMKAAAKALIGFLGFIRENPGISKFIASMLAIGAVVTGLITGLAVGALAFIKFFAIMKAGIAVVGGMAVAFKLLAGATGIGLLLIAILLIAKHWDSIWPAMQKVFTLFVENVTTRLGGLGKILAGVFNFDIGLIKEGLKEAVFAVKEGAEKANDELKDKKISPIAGPDVVKKQSEKNRAIALAEQEKTNKAREAQEKKLQKKLRAARTSELERISTASAGGLIFGDQKDEEGAVDLGEGAETGIAIGANILAQLGRGAEGARQAVVSTLQAGAVAAFGPVGKAVGQALQALSDPKLGEKIVGFLGGVPETLKTIATNALTVVAQTIIAKLPELITALLSEFVPQFIRQLGEFLPDVILTLSENLGPIIDALVLGAGDIIQALVDATPLFITSMQKNLPLLVASIAKQVPPAFIEALKLQSGIFVLGFTDAFITTGIPLITGAWQLEFIKMVPAIVAALASGIRSVVASSASSGGGLLQFSKGGIIGAQAGFARPNADSIMAAVRPGEVQVPQKDFASVVGAAADAKLAQMGATSGEGGGGRVISLEGASLVDNEDFVNNLADKLQDGLEFNNVRLEVS